MLIERDYSRIKASLCRDHKGFWVCELNGMNGQFLLILVSTDKGDDCTNVLQTALRCLSRSDLRKAV